MGDYVPIYMGEPPMSRTTSGAVVGGTLVSVSATGTVATAAANDKGWLGVAAQDAASGVRVAVFSGGEQELIASGTVTAGDLVVCATGGKVSSLAAVTTPTAADVTNTRAIVGVATTTAADTALVRVFMAR